MPQLETGKINCVRLPHYGRLAPGGRCNNARCRPPVSRAVVARHGAGLGSVGDDLVVDLSEKKGVKVDPGEANGARVGAGCVTDVDHATHVFGQAVPLGSFQRQALRASPALIIPERAEPSFQGFTLLSRFTAKPFFGQNSTARLVPP